MDDGLALNGTGLNATNEELLAQQEDDEQGQHSNGHACAEQTPLGNILTLEEADGNLEGHHFDLLTYDQGPHIHVPGPHSLQDGHGSNDGLCNGHHAERWTCIQCGARRGSAGRLRLVHGRCERDAEHQRSADVSERAGNADAERAANAALCMR